MLADEVERQQRVAQVVEHPHEEHHVELLTKPGNVVDRHLLEFDVVPGHLRGKSGLRQVARVEVYSHHALSAASLHLDGVEAAIATDIEHGLAR
jgi:hypothetical protein